AQSKAIKKVSASLKLDLAQYYEVLDFAQFGSDLDDETRKMISHGKRLTELLKQRQYHSLSTEDEVIILLANQHGYIDQIEVEQIEEYETELLETVHARCPEQIKKLVENYVLSDEIEEALKQAIEKFTADFITKARS
ncbi:MAG: F0F1 ATP synthase subunit alpha, partial [Erysipelotrichaceae bacterium]|nr:F0F1 ATP synthase subunit alpha [Erysipelotrichaceae bacterium]